MPGSGAALIEAGALACRLAMRHPFRAQAAPLAWACPLLTTGREHLTCSTEVGRDAFYRGGLKCP